MIILQKYELYLSALFFPWSIAEPLELGERVEKRLMHLSIYLWCPSVVYAIYLINRHYDDYVARHQTRDSL